MVSVGKDQKMSLLTELENLGAGKISRRDYVI